MIIECSAEGCSRQLNIPDSNTSSALVKAVCDKCAGLESWYRSFWRRDPLALVFEVAACVFLAIATIAVITFPAPPSASPTGFRFSSLNTEVDAGSWLAFVGVVATVVLALAVVVEGGHRELSGVDNIWVVEDRVVNRTALARVARIARRTEACSAALALGGLLAATAGIVAGAMSVARSEVSLTLPAFGGLIVYLASRAMRERVTDASPGEKDAYLLRTYVAWGRDRDRAVRGETRGEISVRRVELIVIEMAIVGNMALLPAVLAVGLGGELSLLAMILAGIVAVLGASAASFCFLASPDVPTAFRRLAVGFAVLLLGSLWLLILTSVVMSTWRAASLASTILGITITLPAIVVIGSWRHGGALSWLLGHALSRASARVGSRLRLPDSLFVSVESDESAYAVAIASG